MKCNQPAQKKFKINSFDEIDFNFTDLKEKGRLKFFFPLT